MKRSLVNPSNDVSVDQSLKLPLHTMDEKTDFTDEDELEISIVKKQSSDFQSFMNSAKLCYGNAYLSIPNVFSKTGWLGGILLFVITGLLNIYTMI